jgi:hypothetical protein
LNEQALAVLRTVAPAPVRRAAALNWLGHIAVAMGDYAAARAYYAESLAARRVTPFFGVGVAFTLSGFANLAAARGEYTRAARLAGLAARLCEADGVPPRRVQEAGIHERLEAVRLGLGERAFAAAWTMGQAMTLDQAVAMALSGDDS